MTALSPTNYCYLSLEAVLTHLFQSGLELVQEGFTAALQVLTAEACGLKNECHTAYTPWLTLLTSIT